MNGVCGVPEGRVPESSPGSYEGVEEGFMLEAEPLLEALYMVALGDGAHSYLGWRGGKERYRLTRFRK